LDALRPQTLVADLSALLPLQIGVVGPKQPDYHLFEQYLARHHYLSYGGPVGENVGYLIRSCAGVDLACLLFGAAAWTCAPRDRWIGWTGEQRAQGLSYIANNSRFLILPCVQVKGLASKILALSARRMPRDWEIRYGRRPLLLETLVDAKRFRGTCYRAANWIHAGQTTGRGRMDREHTAHGQAVKDIYVYPLARDARQRLSGD